MNLLQPAALAANPTSCTIRVEMREGTTWQQYEELHRRMADMGFSKTILGDSGRSFTLPDAVYAGIAFLDIERMRDAVQTVADAIYPGAGILVMETPRSAWRLPFAA